MHEFESGPLKEDLRQSNKLLNTPKDVNCCLWSRFMGIAAVTMLVGLLGLVEQAYGFSAFVTGNDYRGMSKLEKLIYIKGAMDGLMMAPILTLSSEKISKPPDKYMQLYVYVTGKPLGQISAIVEKYIESNPQDWHFAMANIIYNAIFLAANPHLKK